jgi:photosynthetic reaction center cytochrome c subunit
MNLSRVIALILTVAALVLSKNSAAQSPTDSSASMSNGGIPAEKTAEQVYANIKALTGTPYGELIPGMQVMSEALGVECEHCHSQSGDRDEEGNPNKDIARNMIRMVRDLNRRSFSGRSAISCYTCHRGSKVPDSVPDLSRADPVVLRVAANLPTARQVIDKFVEAVGGREAIERNFSRIEEGELNIRSSSNAKVPIQILSLAPDKRVTKGFSVSHLGNSAQATGVVNGTHGWMRESNGPVRLMFGWRRDAAQLEDLLNLPRRLEALLGDARVVGVARLETGGEAIVVAGRTQFLPLVEMYFDMQTGLLLRTRYFVDSTVGRMPSLIDYSDYRDIDGVMVPFHWEVTLIRGVRVSYQLKSVRQNVSVGAAQFELPVPPPKLYR